jgi:16S rRNA (cytosine1402-N4)-methyltransferase
MLSETIEGLNIKENGIYIDCTMGGAGHGYEICKRLGAGGRYIGIDQDEAAIEAGKLRLAEFGGKVSIVRSNYCDIAEVLKNFNIDQADGILIDLGVSSYQLDTAERGFSYRFDAPLDMRMDRRQELTAKDMINDYDEKELYRIIKVYGEDRFAKNIAKHIVQARQKKTIETTLELVEIISGAIPAKCRQNGHPAKKTFQAIRIALNKELEVLENTLRTMVEALKPEGRICVITFHSLEDRIVKNIFRECEKPCTCPPSFPVCVCGKTSMGHVITGKPILPGDEELAQNPRSKSAKLRIFEKAADETLEDMLKIN